MDRTERFYKIQALLKRPRGTTMRELQSALDVSRSTLCRDLDYLRDRLGVPIAWNTKLQAYRLDGASGDQELPGIWFSEREIHALLSMMELINQLEPAGLLAPRIGPLKERLNKLLEEGTGSAKETVKRIRILPMAQRPVETELFQTLVDALIHRKRLKIRHLGRRTGQVTERAVSPQRLIYYRDNWYLDAFCHLRDDLRSFALDVIQHAEHSEKPAVSVDDQTLKAFFEDSYGIFNGKPDKIAQLKFTPFRAQWVSREIWHPQQTGQYLPEGSYLLEIPYRVDTELIREILKEGAEVEVLAPASLRQQVSRFIDLAQKLYGLSEKL
jgi:predicted DNA-binding transcriptional regulator YafY